MIRSKSSPFPRDARSSTLFAWADAASCKSSVLWISNVVIDGSTTFAETRLVAIESPPKKNLRKICTATIENVVFREDFLDGMNRMDRMQRRASCKSCSSCLNLLCLRLCRAGLICGKKNLTQLAVPGSSQSSPWAAAAPADTEALAQRPPGFPVLPHTSTHPPPHR